MPPDPKGPAYRVPKGSAYRVVIRSPNWLGDAIMALPAVAALRRHFVDATLAVAAPSGLAPLFSAVEGVDEVLPMAAGRGWPLQTRLRADSRTLREGKFDLAVLFPNSFSSAWVAHQAEIPERWGYKADVRARLLTRTVARSRGRIHHADYYRRLVSGLGIEAQTEPLRLVVGDAARAKARAVLEAAGLVSGSALVGMAPGAAYGHAKRWQPESYASLATELALDYGATCALFGTDSDVEAGARLESSLGNSAGSRRARIVNLIGRTSLSELMALISECQAFVSNDSGSMHLASALGVPVVAIFGPTEEWSTSPIGRHELVINPVWCRPCMLRECPIDHRCMTGIDAPRVLAALLRIAPLAPAGARLSS